MLHDVIRPVHHVQGERSERLGALGFADRARNQPEASSGIYGRPRRGDRPPPAGGAADDVALSGGTITDRTRLRPIQCVS